MMAKQAQLPIKEVMAAIDKKDRGWYSRLSEEKKKAFSAWMIQRYASNVQGKNQLEYLFFVNEFVNLHFSEFSKHPELQWLLLSACGQGKIEYHSYIKPPNTRKKKDKVTELLSTIFPLMKSEDITLLQQLNSKQELAQLAFDHGYDDDSIKKIFGK